MPRTISSLAIAAAAALAVTLPAQASAQTFVTTGRDTMRGLPGTEVAVENIEQDLAADGVTVAAIQADVVRRLQAAGVTVYSSQTANASPAKAYLYVHVSSLKVPTMGIYTMHVAVQLRQTVRSLASNSNIVDAMTWDHNDVVVLPVAQVSGVRTVIDEFVDEFIQDWKSVH
jgi:hypothetical protein